MRLVAAVAAVSLPLAAVVACSSFSATDDTTTPDGSALDATSEPPNDVADAATADAWDANAAWGCKGTSAVWNLATSTPPSPISADTVDVPSFEPMTEDGGTFGRFTISFDEPDGSDAGKPRGLRYGVSFTPSTRHLCLSARIRTPQPTPQNASVDVLLGAGYTGDDDTSFGLASLNYSGSVISIGAGFGPQADSGVPPVATTVNGQQVTDWHVARVETFREAAQLRFTITFDGVEQVDVTPFPSAATVDNGANAFGPSSDIVIAGAHATIDYADIRVDVE